MAQQVVPKDVATLFLPGYLIPSILWK